MPDQPWKPSDATTEIRRLGRSTKLSLIYTAHANDQRNARSLIVGDLLFLLRNGFVYEEARPATKLGYFRYKMECETPKFQW